MVFSYSFESGSSGFCFYLISLSLNIYGKQLTCVILKVCPYVGASLGTLCVLSHFGKRAGFDGNMCTFFAWGMPSATTLIEGGSERKGLGQEPGIRQAFSSAQWLSTP